MGALFAFEKKINEKITLILCTYMFFFILFIESNIRFLIEPIFYPSLIIFLADQKKVIINGSRYGDLSYGIYLIHFPIIQVFVHFGHFSESPFRTLILVVACTISAALLMWHLVEKKTLKRGSHYLSSAGISRKT